LEHGCDRLTPAPRVSGRGRNPAQPSNPLLPPWVFAGTSGPRRLVMVTCGGSLDYIPGYGYSYRNNVIAVAVPF